MQHLSDPSSDHTLFLVSISAVEVTSAIARRRNPSALAPAVATRLLREFQFDLEEQYQIIRITDDLIARAASLADAHALRGYDAVQLAGALYVADEARSLGTSLVLISSDLELNAAAAVEGLVVEDPNTDSPA
jgi:hypothetical protein